MDSLQRVTFRFGGEIEVRYSARRPDPGDLVTHGRDLWKVAFVHVDALGAMVVCKRPRDADTTTATTPERVPSAILLRLDPISARGSDELDRRTVP